MKYKVLPTALLLKNNVKAKSGTIVTADQLTDTPANLIENGFIAEVQETTADDNQSTEQQAADAQKAVDVATEELNTAQRTLEAFKTANPTATEVELQPLVEVVAAATTTLTEAQTALAAILPAKKVPAKK
ncbi:hypothetical protein [Mucilaginibacter sp. L196]|uniref:hypothetical protein n=1 Tax=Mucilaginibacter sp. L196 TaxID=1641870 RepID=UPI00131E3BCB|nr:hypothetical protein [Mucilaginibacter sp. L196]